MTQRIRRVSVRDSDGEQYIDLPVQMHQRQVTYPSVEGQIEHLEKQIEYWKAKFIHLESHLDKFEQFKDKYDKLIRKNRQLETDQREKDFEIDDLKKQLERKKEESVQNDRRRKLQIDDILRTHKGEMENLKEELEKSQARLASFQNQQRKNKRSIQRQLSKLKDELLDANQQLSVSRQSVDRYRGQNSILKKKIQDMEMNKENPLQKNYNLSAQIESLSTQCRLKDDQIFKDRDTIHKLQLAIKLEAEKNYSINNQIQQIKAQNESRVRKLVVEMDRMKLFETQTISLQRELTKLNHIIRTKNQQIDILFHKIDTSRKPSARTNSGDEEYYNEFSKLQEEISQKHLKHKKEKEILEERLSQLQQELEYKISNKNKIIDEKSLIILSLEKELETLKRNCEVTIHSLEDANAQNLSTIASLKRDCEDNQINLGKLKIITIRMEDQIKLLEREKQQLCNDNRTIETRYSHVVHELQEYIRNNRFKENYQYTANRAEIQQLYEAKLSSKDQLIELLRLKLKNFESKGPLQSMFRTGTTLYH